MDGKRRAYASQPEHHPSTASAKSVFYSIMRWGDYWHRRNIVQ
jgi:hypothetical protein